MRKNWILNCCRGILFFILIGLVFWAKIKEVKAQASGNIVRSGPFISNNRECGSPGDDRYFDNYEFVREEYEAMGVSSDEWIPTTIILFNSDFESADKIENTKAVMEKMKELKLFPIVRIWKPGSEAVAQNMARGLNEVFNEVRFPVNPIVYPYNEPTIEGPEDAATFASYLEAFCDGAPKGSRSFDLYFTPQAGYQFDNVKKYVDQTNAIFNLASNFDGAAMNIYGDEGNIQSEANQMLNYLKSLGFPSGKFIISELGPYEGGSLVFDQNRWSQVMKPILNSFLNDSSFLGDVRFTTSAFFFENNTRNTAFVAINKYNGESAVKEYACPSNVAASYGTPNYFNLGPAYCNVPNPNLKGEYRPIPCAQCVEGDIPGDTNGCAESFTMVKESPEIACGSWESDGCSGKNIVRFDWKADFEIDTSKATVPFVGFNKTLPGQYAAVNTNYYINDYFAGTMNYDGQESGSDYNYLMEAGVYRKLAPKFMQDKLKKQLIDEGFSYEISSGTVTVETGDFKDHYPPELEKYVEDDDDLQALWSTYNHDKTTESKNNYELKLEEVQLEWWEKYLEWSDTKWGKMWASVPMFVLDDAPGAIEMIVEGQPGELKTENDRTKGDIIEAGDEENNPYIVHHVSIPHLARLNDISNEMYMLLMPSRMEMQEEEISYIEEQDNSTVIAQAKASENKASYFQILGETDEDDGGDEGATGSTASLGKGKYACENGEDSGPACSSEDAVAARTPADPICCSGKVGIDFEDYVIELDQADKDAACKKGGCNSCEKEGVPTEGLEACAGVPAESCFNWDYSGVTKPMERAVSVQFSVPYLYSIYHKTVGPSGFYNIFKTDAFAYEGETPDEFTWPDTDAKSNIKYKATGEASIDKEEGELYFPFLAGINQTKKCVSENMLAPKELAGSASNCEFERSSRGYSPAGSEGGRPNPSYLGDCSLITQVSNELDDIINSQKDGGCFTDFCLFIQGQRSNQAVVAGWNYTNPFEGKNAQTGSGNIPSMWPTLNAQGIRQNESADNLFESWPESEGKANDNTSDEACAYMWNMHRSFMLYNACFNREVMVDGAAKQVSVCYSNKDALAATTANTQSIEFTENGVTVSSHAYTYDKASGGHVTDSSCEVYGQVCIDDNCEIKCLTNDPTKPTKISVDW